MQKLKAFFIRFVTIATLMDAVFTQFSPDIVKKHSHVHRTGKRNISMAIYNGLDALDIFKWSEMSGIHDEMIGNLLLTLNNFQIF